MLNGLRRQRDLGAAFAARRAQIWIAASLGMGVVLGVMNCTLRKAESNFFDVRHPRFAPYVLDVVALGTPPSLLPGEAPWVTSSFDRYPAEDLPITQEVEPRPSEKSGVGKIVKRKVDGESVPAQQLRQQPKLGESPEKSNRTALEFTSPIGRSAQ